MTTNESSFFRDIKPFEQFRALILPKLTEAAKGSKSLRIWSAACSTGQEPYSILISMMEEGSKLAGWNLEILASDLSEKVLEKARKGEYSQFEVQRGLPIQMLMKYFAQNGQSWTIHEELRKKVRFQKANLLESFAPLGKFDVIFCRNVLIYFDEDAKRQVLAKMAEALNPHGVLFLGSTETIIGIPSRFVPLGNERGLYILGS